LKESVLSEAPNTVCLWPDLGPKQA